MTGREVAGRCGCRQSHARSAGRCVVCVHAARRLTPPDLMPATSNPQSLLLRTGDVGVWRRARSVPRGDHDRGAARGPAGGLSTQLIMTAPLAFVLELKRCSAMHLAQAGAIAKTAEFFSFGTNDLTQMT